MKNTKVVSVLKEKEKIIVDKLTDRFIKLENEGDIIEMGRVVAVYDMLLQCFERRAMLDNAVK